MKRKWNVSRFDDARMPKPDDYLVSLSKGLGKKVVDLLGYVSMEFGDPTFKLVRVVFEDGTRCLVGGEHDMPYLTDIGKYGCGLTEEVLEELRDPADMEDGDE